MKKSILYILAASALVLTACDDMLDKSPRDTFANNSAFWSNPNSVESYSNKFYDGYLGYGSGSSVGWSYFKSLGDDQASPSFDNWTFTTVPSTSSYWNNGFTEVRRVNYFLQGLNSSSLPSAEKNRYRAIARLNRAWQYYQLVREYGDVQWINELITDPEDEQIWGARTDRDVVMDSVLTDLNYAIDNLPTVSDKTAWSKEMAEAMKSDVCLYEGTFCKYRTAEDNGKAADAQRAQRYLQECVNASEALMNSGKFTLTPNYGEIYNSLNLNSNSEIIFYRNYEKDVVMHSQCDWVTNSSEQSGITKDAIDAFLFKDGKPLASTSLDTDDKAVKVVLNPKNQPDKVNYSVAHLFANKDKRLSILVDTIVSFKGSGWSRVDKNGDGSGAEMTSSTGYTIRKYDNASLENYYRMNIGTNYTDAPIYWYAIILLNEAEAKAELGTITQADLDKTVNLLLARGEVPAMTTSPAADPANNMGVSNLLWEIRRCRRCELMTDNWYRYWDLVRWHQLDKIDSNKYPNINKGANLTDVDNKEVSVDANNYMVATSKTRAFDKKYYLFPVPSTQINLSKGNVSQNLGW